MRVRRRTQHCYQIQLFKSLLQLEIKTNQSKDDLDELDKLLNHVLCYPSLSSALIHHNANALGNNDLFSQQNKREKIARKQKNQTLSSCSCCGVLSNNKKLKYSTHLEELNLGLGPFFFYKNYIFHIVVFALLFLIYSLFALITNIKVIKQKADARPLCFIDSIFCGVSQIGGGPKILNSGDENVNKLSLIQAWLGVLFIVLWGLFYWLKISFSQRFILRTEQKRISSSNFTLMLTHVPREYFIDYAKQKKRIKEGKESTQKILESLKNESNWITKSAFQQRATDLCYLSNSELTRKFNKQFVDYGQMLKSNFSYEVVKVNVAKPLYQLSQLIKKQQKKMRNKLHKKLDLFRGLIKQRQNSIQFKTQKQKRISYYNDYMNFYGQQFERNIERQIDYADQNVVFVTLRSSGAKKQILQRNKSNQILHCFNLLKQNDFPILGVNVNKAPQPQEIKWQNVGFPIHKKRFLRFCIWLVSLVLIGLSFAINFGISFIHNGQLNRIASLTISIIVTIINLGIQMIIAYISYYQNQYISSTQHISIALKIAIAQLFNSIGVPIILTIASQHLKGLKQKRWLRNGGLVDDVFYIALLNVFIPLGSFIDPWHQFLKIKRWWYSKPINRLHMHGQKQFNKLFGNYQFDIGYEYAYLIKTTIFTAFFVCMQPIIALFAPIGLILYYLASKRNLFYHYCRPHFYEATINIAVNWVLRLSLIAFGAGHLTFNNFIQYYVGRPSNGTQVANWIILGIGCLWTIILPLRKHCYFPKCEKGEWDYFNKQMMLNSDYDRLNPQTKQSAIYEYRYYLQRLDDIQQMPGEQQQTQKVEQQKHQVSKIKSFIDKIKIYIHPPKGEESKEMGSVKQYQLSKQRKTATSIDPEDSPTVIPFSVKSQQKMIEQK